MSPKTASEWKDYRKAHGERINQNRKARRLEKLESEKLRLMKPLDLETAARPAKSEQQSINVHKSADNSSLAQERELPPVSIAQEQEFAMVSGLSFVAQLPKQSALWVVPQSDCTRNQVAQPDSHLIAQTDAQLEIVQRLENLAHKMDANSRPESSSNFSETRKTGTSLVPQLSLGRWLICGAIILFLIANTTFLVAEQMSLYQSFGYSLAWSGVIAILTELALIGFSALGSAAKGFWRKLVLYGICGLTGLVIWQLLNVSVADRAGQKMSSSETAEMLKKEIVSLEAQEATALQIINNLDPSTHPTKINRLTAKLNGQSSEGFSRMLREARKKLAELRSTSGSLAQVQVLQWQRWLAMLWNIVLGSCLGYFSMKEPYEVQCFGR